MVSIKVIAEISNIQVYLYSTVLAVLDQESSRLRRVEKMLEGKQGCVKRLLKKPEIMTIPEKPRV